MYPEFTGQPSPPYSTVGSSSFPPADEAFEVPPPKRQRVVAAEPDRRGSQSIATSRPTTAATSPSTGQPGSPAAMAKKGPGPASPSAVTAGAGSGSVSAVGGQVKSKRVRTGCLTCRERHLKCDEGTPDCLNCRKSGRECKRGVRLNFIDVQVKPLPYTPPTTEWLVRFEDESRAIAAEYRGGLRRYAPFDQKSITPPRESDLSIALQQQQQQQHRQRHSHSGSAGMMLPSTMAESKPMQMSHFAAGTRQPALDQGYDDGHIHSRKGSDASFLAMSGGGTSMGGGGGNFSLAALQDQFSLGDGAGPRTHAYKTSDVSSIASSMVPQGVGAPSHASIRAGSGHGQPDMPDALVTPPAEKASGEREYLNSPEEIFYMQVFVEEVGVWMDSFDRDKHFSRVIPFFALKSPMLLNAFLACGVKHLTLVNPKYQDDKALFYYDTATTQLLRNLQNPDRDMMECATTAVVLNVYEIMSEKPNQRMSHIAGARALIKECKWSAKSTGIGAACFWLNIGMEVLSCLSFNWQTAWDPDLWGLDLDFLEDMGGGGSRGGGGAEDDSAGGGGGGGGSNVSSNWGVGDEEIWVHRIFYIVAKIANFRANIPKFQEPSPHDEQIRRQSRFAEWKRLKGLCDSWNNHCPRSMRPFGYLYTRESSSESAFPNVWLIKRAAVIGRLFYHTAMVLLHQINPIEHADSAENQKAQEHHAHQVCGIVAHTKDRGIASVAIRSLAISASVLKDPREQKEVMDILEKINVETGWRLGKVHDELRKAWGWPSKNPAAPPPPKPQSASGPPPLQHQHQHQHQHQQQHMAPAFPPAATSAGAPPSLLSAPLPRPPINPLLANSDFRNPVHPYPNWYKPPNRTNVSSNSQAFRHP